MSSLVAPNSIACAACAIIVPPTDAMIQTPFYLIDRTKLARNMAIMDELRKASGAKTLLALKCFATWSAFPTMQPFMDGTTSSSLFELRLGREKFGKETHAYSVAWADTEIEEAISYADKIIFNSVGQLNRFEPQSGAVARGLRLNPRFSTSGFDLADPARPFSRLGEWDVNKILAVIDKISGVMIHYNCENRDFALFDQQLGRIEAEFAPVLETLDWVSLGGGMAVTPNVAKLWLEKTGCPICEGYGLSETSPSASCNPTTSTEFTGTIGVPIPGTFMKLLDDEGHDVTTPGMPGEIAIKGPQVMAGYWQRPDETAKVMTADGYFKSGDVGIVDERGYFKIVDRKKDMILVSGFNVYPNEVEEVASACPGVMECAAIGVPDEKTGEAVKLVVVRKDPALTDAQVIAYCRENMTGYKQPRLVEFRDELPKTPVGKILRRELRNKA